MESENEEMTTETKLNWERISGEHGAIAKAEVDDKVLWLIGRRGDVQGYEIYFLRGNELVSTSDTETWPEVSAVFPRNQWPAEIYAGKKFPPESRNVDPALISIIADHEATLAAEDAAESEATMTTPNIELLDRVIAQITEHPESWDQATWWNECGTAGCVAGWAVHLAGVDCERDCISVAARELLGLHDDALFAAHNTLDAIKVWRQVLAGERVDAVGANLSGANLSGANLSGANLSGADLYKADLRKANLSGANLSGANLSGANLSGANLSWANLSGANLSWANLYRSNLREAYLSGANLSGADLYKADLRKANLYKAKLYKADLAGAIGNADTVLPAGCGWVVSEDGLIVRESAAEAAESEA